MVLQYIISIIVRYYININDNDNNNDNRYKNIYLIIIKHMTNNNNILRRNRIKSPAGPKLLLFNNRTGDGKFTVHHISRLKVIHLLDSQER